MVNTVFVPQTSYESSHAVRDRCRAPRGPCSLRIVKSVTAVSSFTTNGGIRSVLSPTRATRVRSRPAWPSGRLCAEDLAAARRSGPARSSTCAERQETRVAVSAVSKSLWKEAFGEASARLEKVSDVHTRARERRLTAHMKVLPPSRHASSEVACAGRRDAVMMSL